MYRYLQRNCYFIFQKQIFFAKTVTKMTDELAAQVEEGYDFLEKFLTGNQYAAGSNITIADFSIITTLGSLNVSITNLYFTLTYLHI